MASSEVKIYTYRDYRDFVRDLLKTYPKKGHGQFRKMSQALKTDTVTVSQIFSGKRDLTLDQAFELSSFLGLSSLEHEYFMLLVQFQRSATPKYREHLDAKLKAIRTQGQDLKNAIQTEKKISDEAKTVFYSDWRYSAVRILCSIKKYQTAQAISEVISLPMSKTVKILDFLLKYGLVKKQGLRYSVGLASTHLDAASPLVNHRQMTWRLKANEYMASMGEQTQNLFFTGPCSISEKNFEAFREELNHLIKKFVTIVGSEEPEEFACFNLDFFRITS